MLDIKKLKGLVGQLNAMLSEADSAVFEEKEQYSREDDQGEESDSEEMDESGESEDGEDPKMKAKMMAMMLKKKMGA